MKPTDKTVPATPPRQGRLTPMTWALIGIVLLGIAGTVVVGIGLYAVTGVQPGYDTH